MITYIMYLKLLELWTNYNLTHLCLALSFCEYDQNCDFKIRTVKKFPMTAVSMSRYTIKAYLRLYIKIWRKIEFEVQMVH